MAESREALLVVDGAGLVRQFNTRAERLFNMMAPVILDRSVDVLFDLPVHDLADDRWPERAVARRDLQGRRKDGMLFPVRLSAQRLDGGLTVLMVRDARTLNERETALQELEDRYRIAFHTSPDAVTLTRLSDGMYVDINEGFTRLTGFTREDVIGKNSVELGIWVDHADRQQLVAGLRACGQVDSLEAQFRRKDGSQLTGVMSAKVITVGGIPHLISVTRDIDHIRSIESALHESEERFQIIAETTPVAIALTRITDGTILFCNTAFSDILGVAREELLGQKADRLYHDPEERRRLVERFSREGRLHREELKFRGPDGEPRWGLSAWRSMIFGGEEVILSATVDITEQKRSQLLLLEAKELAEVANRAKTDFLAHMSHELRTPLNSVIGFAEVLESGLFGALGSDRNREYVGYIKASGAHLLGLINDLLDVSKIEAGAAELREEEIDVAKTIESCLTMIGDRARKAGVKVSAVVSVADRKLYADPTILKQILLNLLSNSLKFTPAGGRASLAVDLDADGAMLFRVSDTGIGIAEKDIPLVVQPFARVGNAMTRSKEGAGLGLSLVKSLTELHGGTLSITSRPGLGTDVTIRFPELRTRQPPPTAPCAGSGRRRRRRSSARPAQG